MTDQPITPQAVLANEAPAAEIPTAPAPADNSAKFEALARREKQFAKQRQQLKAKEQEIQAKEAEFQKWNEAKQRARQNPDEYLAQAGMTYDDYVQWKLNGGKATPELQVKDDVENVKSELQKMREAEQKRVADDRALRERDVQEQLVEFQQDCHDFVHADPDAYELTALYESEDLVFQTIQTHWQNAVQAYEQAIENGDTPPRRPTIMQKKEAADLVEQYLESLVEKTTKTKKWGKKWGAPPPAADGSGDQPPPSPTKTLSNAASQGATPSSATLSHRNEADAFKRALAKLG